MFKSVLALFISAFSLIAVAQQPSGPTPGTGSGIVVNVSCLVRGVQIKVYGEAIVTGANQRTQVIEYSKGGKVVARSVLKIKNTAPLEMSTNVLGADGAFHTIPSDRPSEASAAILKALGVTTRELGECMSPRKTDNGTKS